jgi:hypothetical protein
MYIKTTHFKPSMKCNKDSNLFLFLVIVLAVIMVVFSFNVMAYEVTATVNFNQNLGQIRSDFYGAGQPFQLGDYNISLDQDCSREIISNFSLAREVWNEAGLKNMRQDGSLADVSSTYNISLSTIGRSNVEMIKWAYENNQTYTLITNGMPEWLANKTSGFCTLLGSSNATCPPSNYTKWGNVVIAALDNYTNKGQYASAVQIEVWNEPTASTWLNNLSTDNAYKSQEYNKLYNATYLAVKSAYPNMKVIGLGGADASLLVGSNKANISNSNITKNWFANFSTQADGYSLHYYYGTEAGGQGTNNMTYTFNQFKNLCKSYGNSYCDNVYITEWNTYIFSKDMAFNWVNQSVYTSDGYTQMINNNITQSTMFKFSTPFRNLSCESTANYSMWFQYQSEKLPNYNITKTFATNHKALNYVVNSTTNNSNVKIVTSYDSTGKKFITLTNTGTSAVNVTLSGLTTGYRDVDTLRVYNISNSQVTINDIPGYGVWTFTDYTWATQIQVSCRTMVDSVSGWIALIGLIGTVFFLGLAVTAVMGYASLKNGNGLSWEVVGSGFLTMVALGMLIIVAIVFFSNLCF